MLFKKSTTNTAKGSNPEVERLISTKKKELNNTGVSSDILIDNIPSMIFVKDAARLKFLHFNKAGEDLLGYSKEELLGKNDYDFFPSVQADFFTSRDSFTLANGKVLDIPEEQIQTRNRGIRTLRTKKIPIMGPNGKPQYLLGISEDITEKAGVEKERRRLNALQMAFENAENCIWVQDDFISIASHEFKTPLTALKMQLQLFPKLLEGVQFPAKVRFEALLKNSADQLDQFIKLVDQILKTK